MRKSVRSSPRLLRYAVDSPPNVDDRPVPRACRRIEELTAIAMTIWAICRKSMGPIDRNWLARREQRSAGHARGHGEAEQLEKRRRHITKSPIAQAIALGVARDEEHRHGIGRVLRVATSVREEHLLG